MAILIPYMSIYYKDNLAKSTLLTSININFLDKFDSCRKFASSNNKNRKNFITITTKIQTT